MIDEPAPERRAKRVDEDWKAQVEAEKEKMDAGRKGPSAAPASTSDGASQQDAGSGDHAQGTAGRQRVSFSTLVEQLAAQALGALGQMPDPRTGQPYLDLDLARDAIDMLAALEAKTTGNLAAEESAHLTDILQQLRLAYTQISSQVADRVSQDGKPRS